MMPSASCCSNRLQHKIARSRSGLQCDVAHAGVLMRARGVAGCQQDAAFALAAASPSVT